MEINHLFFKEEVRNGFYIPGFMKIFWASQMEVLNDVALVCKEHGIKWFASYGTLIGAVRHKGFIPWDDDVDICMLREDYDRFLKVAPKALPAGYFIKSNFVEGGNLFFSTRVYNGDFVSLESDFIEKFHGCPLSAGIDLFVLDNVSDDLKEENERRDEIKHLLSRLKSIISDESKDKEINEILLALEKQVTRFNDRDTKNVSLVVESIGNPHEVPNPRALFDNIIQLPFEFMTVDAPSEYDQYLKSYYGDYMKIDKSGGSHGYPAYEANEKIFLKAIEGMSPFSFDFDDNTFISEEREAYNKTILLMNRYEYLLEEVGQAIESGSLTGEAGLLSQKLINLQNTAIVIGESIEKIVGEGSEAVKILEKSCEGIYAVFQYYANETDDGVTASKLYFDSLKMLKDYNAKRKMHGDAVIIASFEADYNLVKKIYDKLTLEGKTVIVLVVPYYERHINGPLGDKHYDLEAYAKLSGVAIDKVNLKTMHPSEIYTLYGADQTNQTLVIDPNYFTSVIRNYTDKLIYVQPFMTDEISDADGKMIKLLRYYVDIPAFIYADEVLVQSDNIKRRFVDYLAKRYDDKYINIWNEKIKKSNI